MPRFAKLTRAAMRALGAGQKIHEHGIAYERLPSGDGRWTINLRIDGQRIHRVVGLDSGGVTREHVEQVVEQLRTDARHERLNLPAGRKTGVRLAEAIPRYLALLEETGGKDIESKRQRLTDHVLPALGSLPLERIDWDDIERYKVRRLEHGAAPATINRELAALSHLYSTAQKKKWTRVRPKIARLQEPPGRKIYLTVEQAARLRAAAHASDWPYIALFIEIGLDTSMRRSEILSIRLEHISVERREIYVPEAKAGARMQPITDALAAILRREIESAAPGQEWLFPSKRTPSGHMESIESSYRRVVRAAGLDPSQVVRHTLRHTAITHLVQAGVDLRTTQAISGHKTLAMVARYSHQSGPHIRSAMDVLQHRYEPGAAAHDDTGLTQAGESGR